MYIFINHIRDDAGAVLQIEHQRIHSIRRILNLYRTSAVLERHIILEGHRKLRSTPSDTDELSSEMVSQRILLIGICRAITSLSGEYHPVIILPACRAHTQIGRCSAPLNPMIQSSFQIHLASKRQMKGNRLVMNQRTLHIPVVHHLVLSEISFYTHPMTFFKIYPIRPQVHSGKIPGISGQHHIATSQRKVTEFHLARFESDVGMEHLPSGCEIESVDKSSHLGTASRSRRRQSSHQVRTSSKEKFLRRGI